MGIFFVVVSYGVCVLLALLSLLFFALAMFVALGVVLAYVSTARVLWLLWRYLVSPLILSFKVTPRTAAPALSRTHSLAEAGWLAEVVAAVGGLVCVGDRAWLAG